MDFDGVRPEDDQISTSTDTSTRSLIVSLAKYIVALLNHDLPHQAPKVVSLLADIEYSETSQEHDMSRWSITQETATGPRRFRYVV